MELRSQNLVVKSGFMLCGAWGATRDSHAMGWLLSPSSSSAEMSTDVRELRAKPIRAAGPLSWHHQRVPWHGTQHQPRPAAQVLVLKGNKIPRTVQKHPCKRPGRWQPGHQAQLCVEHTGAWVQLYNLHRAGWEARCFLERKSLFLDLPWTTCYPPLPKMDLQ